MSSSTDCVNYLEQQQAFLQMLKPKCRNRILLFRGESGAGKTTLVSNCQQNVCEPIQCIFIQCKLTNISVAEIFSRICKRLGWKSLPNFKEEVAALSGINVNIERNWQVGTGNSIHVSLHTDNQADRDERRVRLTDAWFEDIRASDNPLVIIIDTYEQANDEVKSWISGHFLTNVASIPNIRIAIAGQKVPDYHEAGEWKHCCEFHELNGVPEPHHWLPVVQHMKRRVVEPALVYLTGICQAYNGQPEAIMKFIKGLPPL